MKKTITVRMILLTIVAIILVSCSAEVLASGKVIKATFGHVMAASSPSGIGADYFAELVKKKTNGQIIVEVFPNSQLGGDRDMIDAQTMGSLDFCLPGASVYNAFEPSVAVCSLPFLFRDASTAHKFFDGELAAEIFSVTHNQDITVIATFESGFRQLGTRTPVKSIEDLKGMKIRVPQGNLFIKVWEAIGASPVAMAWNEIFSALQTGVIDGEEAPLANFATMGFGEVAPYFAFINYTYDPLMFTVSNSFLKKLSPEQEKIIKECAWEARAFQRKENAYQEEKLVKELTEKYGMVFVNPDLDPFRKAVEKVYDSFDYQDLLKRVLSEIKSY